MASTPDSDMDEQAIFDRLNKIPISNRLGYKVAELSKGRCVITVPRDPARDGIFDTAGTKVALAQVRASWREELEVFWW